VGIDPFDEAFAAELLAAHGSERLIVRAQQPAQAAQTSAILSDSIGSDKAVP
jgi:hypothetical protein